MIAALTTHVLALTLCAQPPADAVAPAPTVVAPQPAPSPPAKPIRWRLDLSLGVASTRVTDRAFLGLSDSRRVLGAAPMLRVDGRLRPNGRLFVGGGLTYRGTRRGTSLQGEAFASSLRLDEVLVSARLSVMVVEGLDGFAELGVGPSFARVGLSANASGVSATQRDVLVVADGAAGLSLYLPKRWLPHKGRARATGGISGTLGYTLRNSLTVDPTLQRESDAIATTTLPLGDVAMRGLSWRVGLFVRFM